MNEESEGKTALLGKNVRRLPPAGTLSVEGVLRWALELSRAGEISEVVVVGSDKHDACFTCSSGMSRESVLWLCKRLELDTLGVIDIMEDD